MIIFDRSIFFSSTTIFFLLQKTKQKILDPPLKKIWTPSKKTFDSQKKKFIGASIRNGPEIHCLQYAGFF